jgi:internalin A
MPRYTRKPKPPYVPKLPPAAPAVLSVPEPEKNRPTAVPGTSPEAPHVPLPKRIPPRYKKAPSNNPPLKEPSAAPGHLPGGARPVPAKSVPEKAKRDSAKPVPEKAKRLPAKPAPAAGAEKKHPGGASGARGDLLHAKQAFAGLPPAVHIHGNPRRRVPESFTEPAPEQTGMSETLKRRDTAPFTLPAGIFERQAVPEEWSGRVSDEIPVMPLRPLTGGYMADSSVSIASGLSYSAANPAMSTLISRHKIRRTLAALSALVLIAALLYFGIQYSVNEIRKYRVSHTVIVAGDTYPTDMKSLDLSGRSLSDEELLSLAKMHNLTSLTVRDTNITSLESVSRLPYLETLILADCPGISDLTPLKKLGNLTALDISGCTGITDIEPLTSLGNLKSLELNRCTQIMDLTPLAHFTGLVSLGLADLSYQPDLKVLSGMTKLQNLNILRTEVGDLNALSGFANLTKLKIQIRSAADLSLLEKHDNLTSLEIDLSLYDLADLSFLGSFRRLEEFTLTGDSKIRDIGELSLHPNLTLLVIEDAGGIEDLGALSSLGSLKSLVLLKCYRIDDIAPLKGLTALETLCLSQGRFTDISPVSALKALTDLEIINTPVTDISVLWNLRQLEKLSLKSTNVDDISVLKSLSYLRELNIQDTNVKDIGVVSGFTNLVSLNIGDDAITDFSAVAGLMKLTSFCARGSNFTNTVYLSRLSGLKSLDLSGTSIRDIDGLAVLENLESLDISGTATADIGPLSELAYLRFLNLDKTGVTDLETVAGLTRLTELRVGTGTAISSPDILNTIRDLDTLFVLGLDTSADRSGIVSNLKVTRPRLVIYLDQTPA